MQPPVHETCMMKGCDEPHHRRGLCRQHFERYETYMGPLDMKPNQAFSVISEKS